MNNKYFAMIAFSLAILSSDYADAKSQAARSTAPHDAPVAQSVKTEAQKALDAKKAEEDFNQKADLIIDNLLPYLENQWVEGYYGFIYKDPVYMTTGIGTKFSIGKTKMNDAEKERSMAGEIIVNGDVMLDQIPFRHISTGKELSYDEKAAYAKNAKATGCGGSFDGYKRHARLAQRADVVLTKEDARNVTRAELKFKIRRIRKLILNRYKFDLFEKPIGVQMALADIAYMAGEGGLMKYKNLLTQVKAGNYTKLFNYSDCGNGRARNTMRKGIVRLAAYEISPDAKNLKKVKQDFDKYKLDLPLVETLEMKQKMLAQTESAHKQLQEAQKMAAGLTNVMAAPTILSPINLVQTDFVQNTNSSFGTILDAAQNNFMPMEARLNTYNTQVYLDKLPGLGQNGSNKQGFIKPYKKHRQDKDNTI